MSGSSSPIREFEDFRFLGAKNATGTTRGGNCDHYSRLGTVRTELLVFR
jgi:hypothetical protein